MKRILGVFAVALALAGIATTAQAQRTVTYNRTVDGLDPEGYFTLGTTSLTITLNIDSSIVGPDFTPGAAVNNITSIGFIETLPTGWSFTALVAGANNPTIPPAPGATGDLGFAWITPPVTPFSFSFTVAVPGGETGPKTLTGECNYRTNGGNIDAFAADTLIQQKPTTVSLDRTLSGPGVTGALNQFYVPGELITVEVTLEKDGPAAVTALGVEDTLPATWTFQGLVAGDPDNPTIPPANGATGTVGFGWITPPAFPFSFAYNVQVPGGEAANDRTLTAVAKYRLGGGEILSNTDVEVLDGAPCTSITTDGQGGNFYSAGNVKQINVNISETCTANITALGVYQTLPAGWSNAGLVAGDADNPTIPPANGATGTIQFGWISAPAAPFTFSFNVNVPALEEGDKDISGYIEYRLGGGALLSEPFTLTLSGADLTPPVITLTGDAAVTVECGDSYTDAGATATDDRDGDVTAGIVVAGDAVDTTTPGTYTITYNVSDLAGNAATEVTREVTVDDTTAPSIQLTGNASITVECGGAYTEQGATATDTCDTNVLAVTGGDVVDATTPGTYTVTYDASDDSGNAATTVTRTVEVVDATPPTLTLLGAAVVSVECGSSYTDAGATASDACDGNLTGSISTVNSVNTTIPGSYTVSYNVSDAAGNAAVQITRGVNVVDTTAPIVTLVGAATVSLECSVAFVDPGANAADGCDGSVTATSDSGTSVDSTEPGDYLVTYTATDDSGNTGEAQRIVQVRDTTDPSLTLSGQADVTIQCGSTYTDANGTATDTCDTSVTVTNNAATTVDASTSGTYTVTVTATDNSGNTATATRTVTVEDTLAPVIALNGSASVTVECGGSYTDAGATATDGCDGSVVVTDNAASVDPTTAGTYTITYEAVDGAGNAAAAVTRTVTVEDTTDPVLSLVGGATLTLECGGSYTEEGATATDGCDGDITNSIVIAGDTVDATSPGTYAVTYTVADAAGNSSSTGRLVTVADTTDPVLTLNGQGSVTINCGDTYTDDGATATDACDTAPAVNVDSSSVNPAVAGTYTVTITATDASGNTASATRTVVVEDTVAPVVTLNGDAAVTISCLETSYTDAGATANDACQGDLTPTASGQVVTGTPGDYVITWSATDSSGNVGVATRTVTVTNDCEVIGECDDANGNGIADDIFACLNTDGESLQLEVNGGTCVRRVYAQTWFGDVEGSDISVVVANPNDPNQVVTVSVGRDVIGAGQQAILFVSISCTLEDLLGDEAFNLGTTPDGEIAGNAWFDVSIVVSNDGGATYGKLDNSILAGNPVTISINGLSVTPGSSASLQSYSTTVAADSEVGAKIFVDTDTWGSDSNDCAYDSATGTLTCEVSSLSVFGGFEQAEPAAVIEVTPNPAFDFIVGIARPQTSVDNTLTVKNVGGGTLAGAATINDPNGVFTLVGDATYSLAGGASDSIVVRFAPGAKLGNFTATLTLTNSAGAPVTVTVKATSARIIKNFTLFGCGADNGTGSLGADLAVVALALGGLLLSSRSFRRAKQS